MTKKVKAMHAPAGAPGNLQDVADLQQMLAQSQAEIAMLREQVTNLEEKCGGLEARVEEEMKSCESAQEDLASAEDELEDTRARVAELEDEALDKGDIRDLATARRLIRGGDVASGVYELERVLDRSFDSWRIFA